MKFFNLLNLCKTWPVSSSSSMESLILSGEKQILGESTLTCGDESDECGDLPLAGVKTSSPPHSS